MFPIRARNNGSKTSVANRDSIIFYVDAEQVGVGEIQTPGGKLFSTWMRNKRSNHTHEAQLTGRQLSKDDRIIEQAIESILRDIEGYTFFP